MVTCTACKVMNTDKPKVALLNLECDENCNTGCAAD